MDNYTEEELKKMKMIADALSNLDNDEYWAKVEKERDDFYIERLGTSTPLFFLYNTAYRPSLQNLFYVLPEKDIMILKDKAVVSFYYNKWYYTNKDGRIVPPSDEIRKLLPQCDKALLWDELDNDDQRLYAVNAPVNTRIEGNVNGYFVCTMENDREDAVEYDQRVRRKIDGWYTKEEHYSKAVERIRWQRNEISALLGYVKKVDTKKLIAYLDKSGFFYRPSGPNRHHNFPGGLAEHSLGTYNIVWAWNSLSPEERRESELYTRFLKDKPVSCDILTEKMEADDMIVAAICHDLCKAEHYYFKGRRILSHRSDSEPRHAHATLSVKRLRAVGIDTPECEEMLLAVLTHMHLYSMPRYAKEAQDQQKGRGSMLAVAVWAADKLDASRHPAGRLHRDR